MKNEAGYLYPLSVHTATFNVGAHVTVIRAMAPAAGVTLTFSGSGAVVTLAAAFPEYFRCRPGETITIAGACEVVQMV